VKKKKTNESISIGQLNDLHRLHIQPINQLVLLESSGKVHLGVGFPLRCFQRLSHPSVATQLCSWQNNWCTSGSFTRVLSY